MPTTIATAVSSRLVTLAELDTAFGLEDLWTVLEVHSVNLYNERLPPRK